MSFGCRGVTGKVTLMASVLWLFAAGPSQAVEQDDRAVVATAAGQSAETANRIVLSADSQTGDVEALQAFQEAGVEVVELLAEIEDRSLAGAPLSETREQFGRVLVSLERALNVMREGRIELSKADIEELRALLSRLDEQYYARPSEQIESRTAEPPTP